MHNFIVNIDGPPDDNLSFYGWVMVDRGDEFSIYWSPRYNETQVVSNLPPRYLIIDDPNDARNLARDRRIIVGPQRTH